MNKNLVLIISFIACFFISTLTIAGACSVTVSNTLKLNGKTYTIKSISASQGTVSNTAIDYGQSFTLTNDGNAWDTTATGSIYEANDSSVNIGSMNIEIKNASNIGNCKAVVNSYYCNSDPKKGGQQNCTFYSTNGDVGNGGNILFSIKN